MHQHHTLSPDAAATATAAPALAIEVLDRASALRKLPGELEKLASNALEPNVFYEPLMFLPALERMDAHEPLSIVCIRRRCGDLMGVVPLVRQPLRSGVPVKVLRNWLHRYCFLGTPLLHADGARAALQALAQWLASNDAAAGGLQWVNVAWDGPFARLIEQVFGIAPGWTMDVAVTPRAVLEREAALEPAISGKHGKELRRLERRLAERGRVEYATMKQAEDWQPWFETFLALEASGWKGAAGSAIRSRADDATFFRAVLGTAHAQGRLQMMRLSVDGAAIAMKLNLRTPGTAYALKICHDARYARYSPGVLLECYNMRMFAQEPPAMTRMDSCAAANHPMINRLWPARRNIATVTLAHRGLLLRTLVKLKPVARRLRATQPG